MTDKKEPVNRTSYWTEYKKTHYSRVVVEMPPETKEEWRAAAVKEKKSLATFVKDAVTVYITKKSL